ncbi:hypothetical protein [Proteus penneri]|nr:hypothetical protein [Proteus penneri]
MVVHDNRGSAIREINYCRHPDTVNQTDERLLVTIIMLAVI